MVLFQHHIGRVRDPCARRRALNALEAAGRQIISIAPALNGCGAYLLTDSRLTSSMGVLKSEELGYGYSYTGP